MLVSEQIRWASELLTRASVESPRLDAEILLSRAWKKDRAWILAHPEKIVPAHVAATFRRMTLRRSRREPLAYILGYKEFYGREFFVNRHVLVPRPETELLIEETVKQLSNLATKQLSNSDNPSKLSRQWLSRLVTLVDVGTGTGCIAVTLSKLFPQARVFATDASAQALSVARKNARRHKTRVRFLKGELLEPILHQLSSRPTPPFAKGGGVERSPLGAAEGRSLDRARDDMKRRDSLVILANLPYIPTGKIATLQPEIRNFEPRGALDGGRDGLREYRRLLKQIATICHSDQAPQSGARGGIPFASKEILRLRPDNRVGAPLRMTVSVICEIDPSQAKAFRAVAKKILPKARLAFVPSPRKARCAILSLSG